jgi:hypothetical protein
MPLLKVNFCNKNGKAIKPQTVMDYNHHMGYMDKGDRMANSTPLAITYVSGPKNRSSIC